jgi:hypothetical protein
VKGYGQAVPGDSLLLIEQLLSDRFRVAPVRASMSFVGVEPIDVLRFEPGDGRRVYVSVGMSRHPRTPAEDVTISRDGPRAELSLEVHDGGRFDQVWRQLAVLAAAPTVEGVVYRAGMTVDLGQPLAPGARCSGVLVATSEIPEIVSGSGAIAILRVLPATPAELAWARARGGPELAARWSASGTDLLDLGRPAVRLDG